MSSGLIGLLAIVAAGTMFMGHDAAAQTNFFQPCSKTQLSSSAPNTASDIKLTFGIGLDTTSCAPFSSVGVTQWNSGGLIYFTPPDWKVAKATEVDIGAKLGSFNSKAVLGVLNNGCNLILPVPFDLYNGSIDQANKVNSRPVKDEFGNLSSDRLFPMRDVSGNGVPDSAEKWPGYLNAVADKFHMDLTKLRARFVGVNTSAVAGTTVVLNFLVFEPGAKVSDEIVLDPKLGYPAVTVLQDPSSVASPNDPPNDFCAPLWTESNLLAVANGKTFRTNPGDGVYNFVTYVNPAADVDEDGIENGLDSCATTPNASGWQPRGPNVQNPGDKDGDGIPDDCDPDPVVKSLCNAFTGISNTDEDCDGWQNRGDNCPLVKNGPAEIDTAGVGNQTDTDSDGLGDVCDTGSVTTASGTTVTLSPTVANGRHLPVCLVSPVTIGAGGAAPADPTKLAPCDPTAPVGGNTAGTATPVVTLKPGTTASPAPSGGGLGASGSTGIGSLAPTGSDAPAWATMLAAFGVIGVVIGFGLMGSRYLRRRE